MESAPVCSIGQFRVGVSIISRIYSTTFIISMLLSSGLK